MSVTRLPAVHTTTIIIGAGHAGLAMSRRLSERSIDHIILERGQVANSWRTERWDSLRLLTPNWQSRLPGYCYQGNDPKGFMTMKQVVGYINQYASHIEAPIQTQTTVTRLRQFEGGYEVLTNQGRWMCRSVVLAAGPANMANVPPVALNVPNGIANVTPMVYKNSESLAAGGVLVVGGSATGVQLADEIRRSGRDVTLSLGEHVRMPRTYRGRDVFWWMDAAGVLDERYDELDDLVRGRNIPSPQLVGSTDRRTIDLNTLRDAGVEVVGRLGSVQNGTALFSGGLHNTCSLADLKLGRLLKTFDSWATDAGEGDIDAPERYPETVRDELAKTSIHLEDAGISTVLWATGYRPDYSWLDIEVLDRKGKIRHDGGVVTESPGLYTLGTSILRRRRSSFINGASQDSADLSEHLHGYLDSLVSHSDNRLRI